MQSFHKWCRVCLVEKQPMISLFNKIGDSVISQMLETYSEIKINNQITPKVICEECTKELLTVVQFQDKCTKAERFFTDGVWDNVNVKSEYCEYELYNPVIESVAPDEVNAMINENPTDEQEDATVVGMIMHEPETASSNPTIDNALEIDDGDLQGNVNDIDECKEEDENFDDIIECDPLSPSVSNSTANTDGIEDEMDPENVSIAELMENKPDSDQSGKAIDDTMSLGNNKNVAFVKPACPKTPQNLYCCTFCGKKFGSNSALTTHIRTHTGERPFQCQQTGCSKDFKTLGALTLHEKRHSGIKQYVCQFEGCDKAFVEGSNLTRHMNTHTKEKNHMCASCGRGFGRLFLLEIHLRTHTGEKPFLCECGKGFAQRGDLASHKRIHTGERPHKCTVCDSAFIKSSALTKHMKKHLAGEPSKKGEKSRKKSYSEYFMVDEHKASYVTYSSVADIEEHDKIGEDNNI